jgi:hypothetical protein
MAARRISAHPDITVVDVTGAGPDEDLRYARNVERSGDADRRARRIMSST